MGAVGGPLFKVGEFLVLASTLMEIKSREMLPREEVEIEEDCLKILALHQPVAGDLRFIITVIKVNNELERIADIAVNIALRSQAISKSPSQKLV